jgi:hypothetical protein
MKPLAEQNPHAVKIDPRKEITAATVALSPATDA